MLYSIIAVLLGIITLAYMYSSGIIHKYTNLTEVIFIILIIAASAAIWPVSLAVIGFSIIAYLIHQFFLLIFR